VRRALIDITILLLIAAIVTLPNLTTVGLTSSEAHRAVPALTMLNSGDWIVPELFGLDYMRKPQGIFWAFALAYQLLDPTTHGVELAPRLVSAIAFALLALGAYAFSTRWFNRSAGRIAALATLLTPALWLPARAAEIESLHNLTTALGAWLVVEHLRATITRKPLSWTWTLALALAIGAMLLTKGPAGLPALLGLLLSATLITKSIRAFTSWRVWCAFLIASATFVWFWTFALARASDNVVLQTPSAFLFESGTLLKLAGFIPVALLTALPMSLSIPFYFGPDARNERASADNQTRLLYDTGSIIALGALLALGSMMCMGISNDRYAQPVVATLGPSVACVFTLAGLTTQTWRTRTNAVMRPHRIRILRAMTLGSPLVLGALLTTMALLFSTTLAPTMRDQSGREPGLEAAQALRDQLPPGSYTILADAMIEARPELLLTLEHTLNTPELRVTGLWDRGWILDPAPDTLALIRTDSTGDETPKALSTHTLFEGRVHDFSFAIVRLPDTSHDETNSTQNRDDSTHP